MDDAERVRRAIWEQVPELRVPLVDYEREQVQRAMEDGQDSYVGSYNLATEVFVVPYLLPLLDEDESDEAALARCAWMIEYILEARSSSLDDLVGIRIVRHLFREPERWRRLRRYAGPLLKEHVHKDVQNQYLAWPHDEPVV